MTKVLELYGVSTRSDAETDWETVVEREMCPYLQKKCIKIRKSRYIKCINLIKVVHLD